MMKTKNLLMAAALSYASMGYAQIDIRIDAAHKGPQVSNMLYGIFFEDINHAADGGLYAELIRNRSFEDNAKNIEGWHLAQNTSGQARMALTTQKLMNKQQGHALQLTLANAPGSYACLINDGFWGINAVQGRTYQLSFWAKGKLKGSIKAMLVDATGHTTYAQTEVPAKLSGKWTKYTATLTAQGNDPKAKFALMFSGKGQITMDVVSLFPPTFKNRENGCRPELAQLLNNLKPKFMRFPGGCFVEGQDSPDNAFRWERTIGAIEQRPGHLNRNWNYRTSDGLGFHEYLQLAEDLGAKPLYVVNVGLWHGGLTPVEELQPWIDECMNALEYANGDITTKYGAMRARNGHPAPFNIEYLEIGNENNQPNTAQQSDRYYDRFRLFKQAVLAKYPKMHLIGNVVAWGDDNPKWGSNESVELLDEHYYRSPAWFADNFKKYDSYQRGQSQIYCGEYAVTQGFGKVGNLNAALGEAVFMMGMENNADVVSMASYAPIFVNENNVAWQPDMIRFNAAQVMCTPSYYVQQLMASNIGTRVLPVQQHNPYANMPVIRPANDINGVGVGTWATQASYDDIRVVAGNTISDNCNDINTFDVAHATGQWVADGTISQQGNGEQSIIALNSRVSGPNYSYTLRARKNSGNEGFLILFNYKDKDNYAWLNLGGWGNTQHAIEQVTDGAKSQTVTRRGHIQTGKWYDIRIDVQGDSVTCSLDGQQLFSTRLKGATTDGIFSSATLDEPTGEMIIKVVNTSANATTARISLSNYNISSAQLTRLASAKGSDENTLDMPTHVYPTVSPIDHSANQLMLPVAPYSLNIVRLK